jgi:3-hydroxybutyryl-CoA dehydratase
MSGAALGRFLEDLTVGDSAERSFTVSAGDIDAFAAVSHDRNPVHLDEAFARTTAFKGRIAHGMLSAAYVSAVLGNDLPGPGSVYLSQSLRFKRPVKIGDTVSVRVAVSEIEPRTAKVTLSTVCKVDGKSVLEGEAAVLVPRAPKAA